MEKRKKKGFTLIEMVVVLAIIAVLAGIAVPQALNSINKSKSTADIANAKALAGAITQGVAEGQITLADTQNALKIVNTTNISNLNKYISSIPKSKKYDVEFEYKYDAANGILTIGVKDNQDNYHILYPNPEANY